MKHVLITRFALRFAEDNPRRRFEANPGWVENRLQLFNKYTLPSVQAQTLKDFDWWIVLNPEFPGLTQDHILYLKQFANILTLTAPWRENQKEIGWDLNKVYNKQWVCTTRLDSDDIISNTFMSELSKLAVEKETYISFVNGYMMREGKVAARWYRGNPFVSYVEYADPLQSVFRTCHSRAGKRNPIICSEDPSWIQVDHGNNIKNNVVKIVDFADVSFDSTLLRDRFTWRDM